MLRWVRFSRFSWKNRHFYTILQAFLIANYAEVSYGSAVTIRNHGWGGRLLYSHPALDAKGESPHAVYGSYHHHQYAEWIVVGSKENPKMPSSPADPILAVATGHVVRLLHTHTMRVLHAEDDRVFTVDTFSQGPVDPRDYWVIKADTSDKVRPIVMPVRLRNLATGCLLLKRELAFPGFDQIYCSNNLRSSADVFWTFEWVRHPFRIYYYCLYFRTRNKAKRAYNEFLE